jgi:putative tricarboxylic transport membrane protein
LQGAQRMSKNKLNNLKSGLSVTILGLLYLLFSFEIKVTSIGGKFNSRLVPQIISIILIICGAFIAKRDLGEFIKSRKNRKKQQIFSKEIVLKFVKTNRRVLAIFVSSFVYVGLLYLTGFIFSTLLYLFAFMCILTPDGKKIRYIQYAIVSVITIAILYVTFRYGFNMILPRSLIF